MFYKCNTLQLTVHGAWHHGSPSTCIGNFFFIFMITEEHCANRFPEERSPVRTWPMCKQFSKPTTSISLSPISKISKYVLCSYDRLFGLGCLIRYIRYINNHEFYNIPWTAAERSASMKLLVLTVDCSLLPDNFSFFFFVDLALESPHILVPPWVEGMFKKVIPWSVGPSERFKG